MTTKGESRVGIDFNPSGNNRVTKLKRLAADFIDAIDAVPNNEGSGEVARLISVAQTHVETAAMYAVKAAIKGE